MDFCWKLCPRLSFRCLRLECEPFAVDWVWGYQRSLFKPREAFWGPELFQFRSHIFLSTWHRVFTIYSIDSSNTFLISLFSIIDTLRSFLLVLLSHRIMFTVQILFRRSDHFIGLSSLKIAHVSSWNRAFRSERQQETLCRERKLPH